MNRQAVASSILLLALNGCQALLTSSSGPPSVSRIEIDRRPDGSPHVQVTASPTRDQWTIEVTQPFAHTEEVQTSTPQKARRYLFWPLAPLNGLIQCPAGLLASAFSTREGAATLREVGCMRLIAMEPLGNSVQTRTLAERRRESHTLQSPVAGAEVIVMSDGEPVIRRVTGPDGRAVLRGLATRPISGTLTVSVANRVALRQEIVLSASAKDGRAEPIHLSRSAVIQIEESEPTSNVAHRLRKMLLEQGFMVLPAKGAQAAIVDEHHFQMTGRVEDGTRVKSGHMVRPTSIIHASREKDGTYLLKISSVDKGEVQEAVLDELSGFTRLLNGTDQH